MKKIILSLSVLLTTVFTSISSTYALSYAKLVNEKTNPPYWLIILIIGAIIWMGYLYYLEHKHI